MTFITFIQSRLGFRSRLCCPLKIIQDTCSQLHRKGLAPKSALDNALINLRPKPYALRPKRIMILL